MPFRACKVVRESRESTEASELCNFRGENRLSVEEESRSEAFPLAGGGKMSSRLPHPMLFLNHFSPLGLFSPEKLQEIGFIVWWCS